MTRDDESCEENPTETADLYLGLSRKISLTIVYLLLNMRLTVCTRVSPYRILLSFVLIVAAKNAQFCSGF